MREIMQTKLGVLLPGAYDTRTDYVSFKEQEDTRLIYEQNESCEATIGSFQTTHHIKFLNAWGFVRNILINIVWK